MRISTKTLAIALGSAMALSAAAPGQVDDETPPEEELEDLDDFEEEEHPYEEVGEEVPAVPFTADLDIKGVHVRHDAKLGVMVFQMDLAGTAGGTTPAPVGSRSGAPVVAYLFRTSLAPTVAGFRAKRGTLALAVTSHPDFDDTPLWDENVDGDYRNDGRTFHVHWLVLVDDEEAPEGLAVAEHAGSSATLPPTAPGLPCAIDSPGFPVVLDANQVRVVVPTKRIGGRTTVQVQGMTALLRVDGAGASTSMITVERIYDEWDPADRGRGSRDAEDG